MSISKRKKVKNVLNSIGSFRHRKCADIEQGKQNEKVQNLGQENEPTCIDCVKEFLRENINQMSLGKRLPITKWLPAYNSSYLLRDLIAGITVGLTAIPQGIAYANVAGLEPQYGLYSTIVPCFVYIFFGGCKDITLGPTAIMALMTYPYASKYGLSYSVLLCFLSGILILLASVFQLGFLVDFISLPVTTGFTAAAAFTIASAQIKSFLGLKFQSGNGVMEGWLAVLQNLNKISWPDTILGCATILALLFGRYIKRISSTLNGERTSQKIISYSLWLIGLSGNAIVVVCGSLLAYFMSKDGISPFILTGKVNGGLPPFRVPDFHTDNATFVDMIRDMGSAVIAVPLIGIMETIAIGKAFEKGKGVDATQEMIALGLSSLFGSFLGSMPVSGSFTRTAINHTSSVVTPLGGLFTGLLVLMALGFLTSLFYFIPKATLAGLIITAMIFMVEYSTIALIWKTKKLDFIPFCASFFSCLFFGVEYGMLIGICTNLCFILYRIARPMTQVTWLTINNQNVLQIVPKQNLLFPSIGYIRELIIEECKKKNDYSPVIIVGTHIYGVDSTTSKGMFSLLEDLKTRGQRLYLWKWNEAPIRTFIKYNEELLWCIRCDESLDQLLHEPSTNINDEVSSNAASNEQLTHVPIIV